jgi:signal transduction histidine kinase
MVSVGGLAAGMAHEINNPPSGIRQNLQVIQKRLSTSMDKNRQIASECATSIETVRSYLSKRGVFNMLEMIDESSSRAAAIVRNMLNFSRMSETGEFIQN